MQGVVASTAVESKLTSGVLGEFIEVSHKLGLVDAVWDAGVITWEGALACVCGGGGGGEGR
jgi:hypothetical protein